MRKDDVVEGAILIYQERSEGANRAKDYQVTVVKKGRFVATILMPDNRPKRVLYTSLYKLMRG
jgi:hypothetical protein